MHPFQKAFCKAQQMNIQEALEIARDHAVPGVERQAIVMSLLSRGAPAMTASRRDSLIEEFLHDPSTVVQRTAITACMRHTSGDSVTDVLWRIGSEETSNQVYALRTLAQFGDVGVIDECRRLLDTGSQRRRRDVAIVLGFLKTTEALCILQNEFEDAIDESHKFILACGIARCGSDNTIAYLQKYLGTAKGTGRIIAVCTLAATGSTFAIRELESFLSNASFNESEMARRTLLLHDVEGANAPNWEERVLAALRTKARDREDVDGLE